MRPRPFDAGRRSASIPAGCMNATGIEDKEWQP
jgi:hypothetical protein